MIPSAASDPAGVRPSGRSPYRGPTQVDSSRTTGVVQVMGSTATTASGELTPTLLHPSDALQTRLHFSGHGGEYFRIWLVNVLLTALTLTLYRPWARVRTLRYFHGHTRVERYPLDFHGNPRRMLLGHVLVGALLLGAFATPQGTMLSIACGVTVAVLWPALFRSAMQFRMANTSWRGLRFSFRGSLGGSYLVFVVPAVLFPVAVVAGGLSVALVAPLTATLQVPAPLLAVVVPLLIMAPPVAVLALGFPLALWLLRRYQHDNLGFAQYRTEFRVGIGAMYGLCLRALPLALLCAAIGGALIAAGAVALLSTDDLQVLQKSESAPPGPATVLRMVAFVALLYLVVWLASVPVRAYFTARLQNLVWSRTGSRIFRFKSELSARALTTLMLKNAILNVLTLWLYHPFAKVAVARLRIEAVTLVSRTSLDELMNHANAHSGEGVGDAAGDLLGVDLGM